MFDDLQQKDTKTGIFLDSWLLPAQTFPFKEMQVVIGERLFSKNKENERKQQNTQPIK